MPTRTLSGLTPSWRVFHVQVRVPNKVKNLNGCGTDSGGTNSKTNSGTKTGTKETRTGTGHAVTGTHGGAVLRRSTGKGGGGRLVAAVSLGRSGGGVRPREQRAVSLPPSGKHTAPPLAAAPCSCGK